MYRSPMNIANFKKLIPHAFTDIPGNLG